MKTISGNRYSEDIEQDKLLKQTSLLKTKKKLSDWSIQTSAPEAVAPTTQKPENQWPVKSKKSDQVNFQSVQAFVHLILQHFQFIDDPMILHY